jgi:hypothetical protein
MPDLPRKVLPDRHFRRPDDDGVPVARAAKLNARPDILREFSAHSMRILINID